MRNAIVLWPLIVWNSLASGAYPAKPQITPAFTPNEASIAYCDGTWVVWTTREVLNKGPRLPRALTFRTQYLRQRLNEEDAVLVFEMTDTLRDNVVAVLDDGTVLLSSYTQLTWAFPDGTTMVQHLRLDHERLRVNGGFRDGLLLQPYRLAERAPVYFVPIVNRELHFATKFLVTDEPGVSVNSPPRFVRSGKWLAYGHFLTNLSTKERSKVEGLHPLAMPSASDGETVVFWGWPNHVAVSLPSRTQALVDFGRPQRSSKYIFAVRNGIGYFFDYETRRAHERTLRAISLSGKPVLSSVLLTIEFPGQRRTIYDFKRIPHLLTDDALVIWNGTKWEMVSWLNELGPRQDDESD